MEAEASKALECLFLYTLGKAQKTVVVQPPKTKRQIITLSLDVVASKECLVIEMDLEINQKITEI